MTLTRFNYIFPNKILKKTKSYYILNHQCLQVKLTLKDFTIQVNIWFNYYTIFCKSYYKITSAMINHHTVIYTVVYCEFTITESI